MQVSDIFVKVCKYANMEGFHRAGHITIIFIIIHTYILIHYAYMYAHAHTVCMQQYLNIIILMWLYT